MMNFRFLYQGRVEPVRRSFDDVTIDKWQHINPINFKKASYHAALAVSFFFVAVVSAQAEDVTVDKWFSETSQPVRIVKRTTHFQELFYDSNSFNSQVIVNLDKWFNQTSLPVRIKQKPTDYPYLFIDSKNLTISEVVSLDKWFNQTSIPVRVKPRIVFFDYLAIDPTALTLPSPAPVISLSLELIAFDLHIEQRRELNLNIEQQRDFAVYIERLRELDLNV